MKGRGHFIHGVWSSDLADSKATDVATGAGEAASEAGFQSLDPATGKPVWEGFEASSKQVDDAVKSARSAFPGWAALTLEKRASYLNGFAENIKANRLSLADMISLETGKPNWEALQEVDTMVGKVSNSLEAYRDRCGDISATQGSFTAVKRFRAHGVVAVLGPFNLPGHLPHSHIVPALLAGNTVIYKPSEMTPGVGEATTLFWKNAGLPNGVLNLVQGGRNTGVSLSTHQNIDGLFFTGSHVGGVALSKVFAATPGKILTLELGGNNPLVIWDSPDAAAAALITAQSAFLTSGQRCVCARRLILPEGPEGDRHLEALLQLLPRLRVGFHTDRPEPFMGPVISVAAADRLEAAQGALVKMGGRILVPMQRKAPTLLTPGIVDMTHAGTKPDEEFFGPLLQVIRVPHFDAALEEANRTRFGLAAGLLSSRRDLWEIFYNRIRAGVVNWNRQTTGASGKLPFGGIGESGNHRPSAYYAADYCAYPVASLEATGIDAVDSTSLPVGVDP